MDHFATEWDEVVLADRLFGIQSKEPAGGIIEKSDRAIGFKDEHALLQGLEDILQKALLAHQPVDQVVYLARAEAIEPRNQFFDEPAVQIRLPVVSSRILRSEG